MNRYTSKGGLALLKREYQQTLLFYRLTLRRYNWIMTAIFWVTLGFTIVWCMDNPTVTNQFISYILTIFDSKGLDIESSTFVFSLICNNVIATAIGVVIGLIPFLFLPILMLAENAAIIGVMAAFYYLNTGDISLFLLSTVAHGIFELPALILSAALGLLLCVALIRKIVSPTKAPPFFDTLKNSLRFYLLVIFPLLLIAGAIEAYITPVLAGI